MELVRRSDCHEYFGRMIEVVKWINRRKVDTLSFTGETVIDPSIIYTPYIPLTLVSTPVVSASRKLKAKWSFSHSDLAVVDAKFLYKIVCPCCKVTVKLGYNANIHRQHYVMDMHNHSDSCDAGWRTHALYTGFTSYEGNLQDRVNNLYVKHCFDRF